MKKRIGLGLLTALAIFVLALITVRVMTKPRSVPLDTSIKRADTSSEHAARAEVFDLREIFPYPNKLFHYVSYDQNGQLTEDRETEWTERWPDGVHFTIHRFFSGGRDINECPRIDDVFVWQDDVLYYTDTIDFFENWQSAHMIPGDPVGSRQMRANVWVDSGISRRYNQAAYPIQHENCRVTFEDTASPEAINEPQNNHVRILNNRREWSPVTGGPNRLVSVIILETVRKVHILCLLEE
jgi:hypothetical protein